MKNSDYDGLDPIVDSALAAYSGAEPLAGIEQRVLNRVRSANTVHQGPKSLGWAVACPIILAAAFLAIARWTPVTTPPPRIPPASVPAVRLPVLKGCVNARPRHPRMRRAKGIYNPISPEEHMLLAFVRSYPAESEQFLADTPQTIPEPVEVHEIEIAPLQIPEVQLEENN